MGPTCQLGGTNFIRVRASRNLGETDHMNSMRPISVIGTWRVGQANSVGPIAHFGETKTLEKGTESLHCELGGTDRSSRLDRDIMKGNREFVIPSR